MPPELLAGARRILVIRPDNVGDVVLTSPLLRNLRAALPAATLGLLASPAGAAAAPLLPWVDEVLTWRPVWQDLGGRMPLDPDRELALIAMLRDGRWDAALIATSWNQTAWPAGYATYLAGIPVRVGFARDFGGSVLSHPVAPPADGAHQAERNLALLAAIGVPVHDDVLELRIPSDARTRVEARLAVHDIAAGEPIVVVPGASAPARRMSADRFGRVATGLAARTGRPIVVATTPRERPLLDTILEAAPTALSIGDDLTVPEYAALIGAAALVVCGNSSALHLADALRRPVVVAFAGTDRWSQWQPRSTPAAALSVSVDCAPCYRIECPIGNACLALDPMQLADRGEAVLAIPTSTWSRAEAAGMARP